MILLLVGTVWMTSCDNFFSKSMEGKIYKVYSDEMIDEMMKDQGLTSFLSIVDKAEYTGTIHAYGTYTLFAPTNEAVNTYLAERNITDINALTKEEAVDIVKYHLVKDTLRTTDFIIGRLASPNFAKKYLTTKEDGDYYVNRQAKITVKDLRGANGILQVIDKVLTPPQQTITDAVRALPSDYSIMKEVFERSGMADSFAVVRDNLWYTFFIQDDNAFIDAGIHSVDELLADLRKNTPAIENADTLLRNYIAYHGVNSLMYVADLLYISSMQTVAPKQVITFKRNLDVILLNELNQGKMVEAGIPLDRTSDFTDYSCSNGVIHKINGNIQIKNRTAYRIDWDVAEQPEIIALKNFRKPGTSVNFAPGDLSEVTWGGRAPTTINYWSSGYPTVLDEKSQYVYADALRFNLYSLTNQWIEFKTPVLIEGKYKVWLCYRRELELKLKSIFKQQGYDDQVLPYIFDMSAYMPNPSTSGEEAIEIDGWKQYNAKKYNSVVCSHLLGIIDVQSTGRHVMRFEATTGGRGSQAGSWDLIQFIPIEEDQLWPKVDIKGNWVGPEVPNCQIFPENECPPDTTIAG
ncbi:MAG TPA: fasciclin domain-containing protein [Bacteroidales bacterium]|nr:fasciclin domain-containing protein [Bacteroidales bacterium]